MLMSKTVGELIREARMARGLSKAELARQLDISAAAISQWEIDKTAPELHRFQQVVQVLGIDLTNTDVSNTVFEHYGIGDSNTEIVVRVDNPERRSGISLGALSVKDFVQHAWSKRLSKAGKAPPNDVEFEEIDAHLKQLTEQLSKMTDIGVSSAPIIASDVRISDLSSFEKIAPLARDVPVRGIAVGGDDGDFRFNGQDVDRALRPSGLKDAADVFAVYVSNDSMYPAWREGALCYVSPHRPPMIGDDVIIQLKETQDGEPGAAFIKRLKARTATRIIVEQFNPAKDIEFSREVIAHLYRVIPWEEALGLS